MQKSTENFFAEITQSASLCFRLSKGLKKNKEYGHHTSIKNKFNLLHIRNSGYERIRSVNNYIYIHI